MSTKKPPLIPMPGLDQPYPTLYFFMASGCAACHEAAPFVQRFQATYPLFPVVWLNLAFKDWEINGWSPKGTPGYLLVVDNESRAATDEGALTYDELVRFVNKGFYGPPQQVKKRKPRGERHA